MTTVRVGINGFGRIGRCVFKQLIEDDRFEVAGINDLSDHSDLAYLLKYDSVHGWYPRQVSSDETSITVADITVPFHSERDPADLPWEGVDVVLECTGAFRSREAAAGHLAGGARRVIISAPSDDADTTLVYGVNHETYDPDHHHVISNASCTTNCLAPVAKALHDTFGIEYLMMSTVHAYTSSQSLMDTPTRKRRRGRAAAVSIIPTTTGATNATARVIPELEGRMDGMAFRVPVENGSVCDIVIHLETDADAEAVNGALAEAASTRMAKVLRVTDEALVSRDIIGDTHSSVVDSELTMGLRDRVVKVVSWYDNEWGYSARLVDMAAWVGGR